MAHEIRIINQFVEDANSGDHKAYEIRASKRFTDALIQIGHTNHYLGLPVVALKTKSDSVLIVLFRSKESP